MDDDQLDEGQEQVQKKIDVEDHLEEPQIKIDQKNKEMFVNNPFTGEEDEESITPSPMKQKKIAQMKTRACSLRPAKKEEEF